MVSDKNKADGANLRLTYCSSFEFIMKKTEALKTKRARFKRHRHFFYIPGAAQLGKPFTSFVVISKVTIFDQFNGHF